MDTNIYVALSHQVAMRRQMDIIANNVANMNTTAFKRESVMFREYVNDVKGALPHSLRNVAFVQDYGISREMSDGEYQTTGNPFDVAISGKGLFKVQRDNGDIAYTRNGRLALAEDGTIVLSTGQPILDADDNTIQLPSPAYFSGIEFANDGTIWSKENGIIGKLAMVTFEDTSKLNKIGDNLFITDQPPIEDPDSRLLQGVTESSNVQPIVEITKMINVTRSYIQMAKMIEDVQNSQNQAINRLTRLG